MKAATHLSLKPIVSIFASLALLACESPYGIQIMDSPDEANNSKASVDVEIPQPTPSSVDKTPSSPGPSPTMTASPGPSPTTTASPSPSPMSCSKVSISGSVVDATTGSSLSGVNVAVTYGEQVLQNAVTDTTGSYLFENLPPQAYRFRVSKAGYIDYKSPANLIFEVPACASETKSALSPQLSQGQIRIVLTWTNMKNNAVRDMDSYLKVPGYADPVYYNNCNLKNSNGSTTSCTVKGTLLDLDDTNWAGPETITIDAQLTGKYTYYIANYSSPTDMMALGRTSAIVTVYSGSSTLRQYTVPEGTGLGYAVFSLENGTITDLNKYLTNVTSTKFNSRCKYVEGELWFNTARPQDFNCY